MLIAPTALSNETATASQAGVLTSSDGQAWALTSLESQGQSVAGDYPVTVAGGPTGVVIGGTLGQDDAAIAWHSAEGRIWTRVEVDGDQDGGVLDVAAGSDGFVLVGYAGHPGGFGHGGRPAIWSANDGSIWQRVGPGLDDGSFGIMDGVVAGGPGYVAFGQVTDVRLFDTVDPRAPELRDAGAPWTSTDGRSWSRVEDASPFAWAHIDDVIHVATGLMAFGTVPDDTVLGYSGAAWTSDDGLVWERLDGGPPLMGLGQVAFLSVPGVRVLEIVTFDPPNSWLSDDGSTWRLAAPPSILDADIRGLVVSAADVIAVGQQWSVPTAVPGCFPVSIWKRPIVSFEQR